MRRCIYCGVTESQSGICTSTGGHAWQVVQIPTSVPAVMPCPMCQRGEPCVNNLKITLEAENARLRREIEILEPCVRDLGARENGLLWQSMDNAPKDRPIRVLGVAFEINEDGSPLKLARKSGIAQWNPDGTSWVNDAKLGHSVIKKTGVWMSGGGWFQPDEVEFWSEVFSTQSALDELEKVRKEK